VHVKDIVKPIFSNCFRMFNCFSCMYFGSFLLKYSGSKLCGFRVVLTFAFPPASAIARRNSAGASPRVLYETPET